jgi:hypothetical protein
MSSRMLARLMGAAADLAKWTAVAKAANIKAD